MIVFDKMYIASLALVMMTLILGNIYLFWIVPNEISIILTLPNIVILFLLKLEFSKKIKNFKSDEIIVQKKSEPKHTDFRTEIEKNIKNIKTKEIEIFNNEEEKYKQFKDKYDDIIKFFNNSSIHIKKNYPYLEIKIKDYYKPSSYPEYQIRMVVSGKDLTRDYMGWQVVYDDIFELQITKNKKFDSIIISGFSGSYSNDRDEINIEFIDKKLKLALATAINKIRRVSSVEEELIKKYGLAK